MENVNNRVRQTWASAEIFVGMGEGKRNKGHMEKRVAKRPHIRRKSSKRAYSCPPSCGRP